MSTCSLWPIERTLSGVATPGLRGPRINANERVLCIPQSSSITGASLSDCLISYPGQSLPGRFTPLQGYSRYFNSPSQLGLQWKCNSFLCVFFFKFTVEELVGWLFFCFTAYKPFSGHLTANEVILTKVSLFQGLHIFKYLFMVYKDFQRLICFYILWYCSYFYWFAL